ncbi:hypothetical protein PR202_ga23689 [Eleusine coracana subsp. coracana]|uniref:Glycosyltransferase 61 catalytic domain-containing protein n=1 Tax=Eleusine coracana subsp. coracana TaxID=191504 RepID=A0AAV5D6Y9_ELECO|nr:hypothetical protein QOZ80_1AG0007370 [Eleusine coracana subsp. coracana]GJN06006.1 hypothetical protein PR202_ga23689 [Eleusine coracana subsp. coracana]
MGGEVKPGRAGLKSWAQRHLNSGFVVGFFLVLFTYLVVSRQFAISAPNAVVTTQAQQRIVDRKVIRTPEGTEGEEKSEQEWQPKVRDEEEPHKDTRGAVPAKELPERDYADGKPFAETWGKVVCNTHGPYSDTCELDGDVRINGTALSVTLVPSIQSERREWKVPPYPRKHMLGIDDVTVTQLGSPPKDAAAPACTVTHDVPAVLFALGGLTGNYWHDFSDVLVPLFAASRRYAGDVVFLVANIQPWWLGKYEAAVRRLSKHDAVDLGRDRAVRCFRHVTVGLQLHKELSIVPEWAPGGRLTMADFTAFLREAYALPRAVAAPVVEKRRKPRVMVIHRAHYRRFVNVQEVARAAEAAGFEAVVTDPRGDGPLDELARAVNSFDALLGVHGAGLTNAVFLPARAVVIQVVPYGKLEPMARTDFGEPVADMGLKYLEYSVAAEESTLLEMLGPDHPVIKDPESVHRSGWDKVAEFYLGKQDVRINVTRFAPTLEQAMQHLRKQRQQ